MSFDAIAPHYRWLECVTAGSLLQQCRTAFIHELAGSQNILLLGEGRGRFLVPLLRLTPHARITCLDSSARMLELTRSTLNRQNLPEDRIQFIHADVLTLERNGAISSSLAAVPPSTEDGKREEGDTSGEKVCDATSQQAGKPLFKWTPTQPVYDAVASHCFLDCFRPEQLRQIIAIVARMTSPGARWLISDFCVPDAGWQRKRARLILGSLYVFFRVATGLTARRLTPPDHALKQAGFQLKERRLFNHGLLHSDVWSKGAHCSV